MKLYAVPESWLILMKGMSGVGLNGGEVIAIMAEAIELLREQARIDGETPEQKAHADRVDAAYDVLWDIYMFDTTDQEEIKKAKEEILASHRGGRNA